MGSILLHRVAAGLLADVDLFAIVRGLPKQGGVDEVVVDDDVAGGDEVPSLDRDETKVAGTGSDQVDFPRFAHPSLMAERARSTAEEKERPVKSTTQCPLSA